MIITLTGSNSFMLHQRLQKIIDVFVVEHTDMGLEKFDGGEAEFDKIRESLQSLPFLASKKLIVLRTPSILKQFIEQAEILLAELPETTDVILVEPKLDKRSSYYKFLSKHSEFHEFGNLDEQNLSTWLVQMARNNGNNLRFADARYLVERLGTNQQLLAGELDKLSNFNSDITKENIDLLVEPTPQSTIFQLLEAALNGRTKMALKLYDEQRIQKTEPFAIIAMLAWQLHVVAIIKTAGARSDADIASEAKLSPFVVRKSRLIADRLSFMEVKLLLDELLRLDERLKTENIDADEALKNFLLKTSF
ncbi:DNA polymerase III subunit delta [Candidatus Saccharibacteria bacterium]|nr:DNA polymerase III subunit delta [Candidatus Saccharibacteria bacterium]MBI3338485.1 DNA polymerase III subunit delta [Candidatus Saccharibacteria bacterium]